MSVLNLHILTNIYCWKITETEEQLKDLVTLSDVENNFIFSFKRKQRRKELLATRALLARLIPNEHIHYNNRNPFLVNSTKEISISNSDKLVVIQLNDESEKTGIDIQFYSDTVLKVKHKFLHKQEYGLFNETNELEILNIIWSAKESLYKAYSEDKLEFKKHIVIQSIKNDMVEGIIDREGVELPFKLGLFTNNEFVLTWYINR